MVYFEVSNSLWFLRMMLLSYIFYNKPPKLKLHCFLPVAFEKELLKHFLYIALINNSHFSQSTAEAN